MLNASILLVALLTEATIGYPPALFRAIGHPVTWIGALIVMLDRRWNRGRRCEGVMALLVLIECALCLAVLLQFACLRLVPLAGTLVAGVAASTLLAQRSLHDHVAAVARALERDGLAAGRAAVGMIVGRDLSVLDEAGVARAAIESLAENFSDGVVAPAFWCAVGGLPGIALYKAANTADSMIGHRSERYLAFGWAAARFDDLVNLPASRLAALWLALAVALSGEGTARDAWVAVRRDARRHRSPNAGWPEAAMAGGLGLRLAGPRVYAGVMVEDAFMGDGRAAATASDIRRALCVYRLACAIQLFAAAIFLAVCQIASG